MKENFGHIEKTNLYEVLIKKTLTQLGHINF